MSVGLIQSVEGLNRTKSQTFPRLRENSFCLTAFELGHQDFSCLWIRNETLALPGPLDGNYTINSPRAPACPLTLQILGLVSLHNCVTQFLIINTSLSLSLCLSLSPHTTPPHSIGFVSLENPNTDLETNIFIN